MDGDGVADKKERFFTGVGLGRDGNLEHEQSGFIWGLDNWIYSTYNAFRFRWTPTGILREPTAPNCGQWGLAMDDDGKPWFVDAGGERGPMNFQVPDSVRIVQLPRRARSRASRTSGRSRALGDMEGGMLPRPDARWRAESLHGDQRPGHRARARGMPADLQGDLLICEPVGRLIRRAKVVKTDGLTSCGTRIRGRSSSSAAIRSSGP